MDFIDPLTPTAISDATGGAFRGKVQAQSEGSVPTNIVFDWLTGINKELYNIIATEGGLTPNVSDNTQLFQALASRFANGLTRQIFNVSGSYTPTLNTKSILIEVQGAGGGGGGADQPGNNQGACGGGGAGGSYRSAIIDPSILTLPATIIVGAGGSGGGPGAIAGSAGGNSQFTDGSFNILSTGGGGGLGESASGTLFRGIAGGSGGGGGTGGDIVILGANGGVGTVLSSTAISSRGGQSALGIGAEGVQENLGIGSRVGSGYGGGGGGAAQFDTPAGDGTGGDGAPGIVIVTELF